VTCVNEIKVSYVRFDVRFSPHDPTYHDVEFVQLVGDLKRTTIYEIALSKLMLSQILPTIM